MKKRTGAFLKELGFLPINSRDEFCVIRNFIEKQEFDARFLEEELELAQHNLPQPDYEEIREILQENAEVTDVKRAAAFFKLIRYSYGSGCTSYSCQPFDVRKCFAAIWEASRRLADTVVENKDFEALIRQYDREDAFFYCDPPYFTSEYVYDCGFTWEDHLRLYHALADMKGKFLLSYNDCPEIRELYQGYHFFDFKRVHSMAQKYEAGKEFPELLIANYDLFERERQQPHQLTLFDSIDKPLDYEKILKENIVCRIKR